MLSNAVKYSAANIVVSLGNAGDENRFEIKVASDGNKIQKKFQEKIFEPFFRLSENEHQMGTGIGLSISRTLAELHKGILFLGDSDDKMNIFILRLPCRQIKIAIDQAT